MFYGSAAAQGVRRPGKIRWVPLFWRVFLLNAALVVAAGVVLGVSPVRISTPTRVGEELVLGVGVLVVLAANYLLMRPAFAPLERLAEQMNDVDLLRPGGRVSPTGSAEVVALVHSFNEMLTRLEAERRESGGLALSAQEGERKRIATELHDEVGQTMTGVLLLLEQVAGEVPAERREMFVEAKEAVRESLEEVRRIAQELRPELLEHLGLVSALKSLAATFADRAGLALEWDFARELPALSAEAELAVYRIAQESLTNIARHAQARHVWLSLQPGRDSVVLRVVDNGRGLDGRSEADGSGLRGMRERAVLVGAALAVKPAPTGGVEVRLEVPMAEGR
jgi:two-component system sensor histidine kinase UhpB